MGGSKNGGWAHDATQRIAGLDGLRGLAVSLVLGFHLYPRLIPGGWLGVSLFFTLSGFLITTVILRDIENGTFTFRAFYARRVRRLVPASVLVLTLFALTWTVVGWFDENHRSDVLFSLLQISNWQQIWEGVPYGTALASPVVHYWSLAIEEQAYLVLPLLIVLSGRTRLLKIAVGLFALSALATFLADGSQSIIYFGTHTRAAEILAGVIVAAAFHNTSWRPQRFFATAISTAGVGYLVWASLFVHLKDSLVYTGGLLFTGLVSASVIAALPQSRIAAFFDLRPFAWLGTVSYGVYLLHWPILMTLKRTDLPQWTIPLLTLALTLALSMIMYRTFELPMRFSFSPRKVLAVLSVCVVCVGGGFALAKTPPASFEDLQNKIDQTPNPSTLTAGPKIFYFGDSKMLTFTIGIGNGMTTQNETSIFSPSMSFTHIACPLGRNGYFKNYANDSILVREECNWDRLTDSPTKIDVGVIWSGTWDVSGRSLNSDNPSEWWYLDSSRYQDWLLNEYRALFHQLRLKLGVKEIFVIDYLGVEGKNQQVSYTNFLNLLATDKSVTILRLTNYLEKTVLKDFFPDGTHLSTGKPMGYSPNNDNSATDLYEKWFEPALCAALLKKAPELLTTKTCPEIDYSPRVKQK